MGTLHFSVWRECVRILINSLYFSFIVLNFGLQNPYSISNWPPLLIENGSCLFRGACACFYQEEEKKTGTLFEGSWVKKGSHLHSLIFFPGLVWSPSAHNFSLSNYYNLHITKTSFKKRIEYSLRSKIIFEKAKGHTPYPKMKQELLLSNTLSGKVTFLFVFRRGYYNYFVCIVPI